MECDRYTENGQGALSTPQAWACGVKRKFGDCGMRVGESSGRGAGAGRLLAPGALLAGGAMLAGGISASPRRRPEPRPSPRAPLPRVVADPPFMNNMDEITFWIVTKRAPCLAGYNNPLRHAPAHCSRAHPHSITPEQQGEPESKRKRLAVALDDSETTDKPNVYYEALQPECEVISDEKSDTLVSDVDFNIKKSSVQVKNKKSKTRNRNSRTALHKKNKVVTSTPKVTSNLRRSLRKVQSSLNNNSHLNSTLDIFDTVNGDDHPTISKCQSGKYVESTKIENSTSREQHATCTVSVQRPNNGTMNGQFDDISDVSGFTANYIKSTKINSKTPRKVRGKHSRNLAKEIRPTGQNEAKSLIVSINKATGDPKATVLNCSTDSSQNIINLVTVDKNSKVKKVDKSTSLLKFMKSKKVQKGVNTTSDCRNGALNTSFQSTSTTGSRYPKRHKNNSSDVLLIDTSEKTDPSKPSSDKRTITNQSSKLESTEMVSRTRSGRSRHAKVPETSVYVCSNFTEQESTVAAMNVASVGPDKCRDNSNKKRLSSKCGYPRKSLNKTVQSNKDSFREKSGFAACFSDSDDDKPLKPQKYLS